MNPGSKISWVGVRRLIESVSSSHHFWRLWANFQKHSAEMELLKGACCGKRCFIMGGGPSLKLCDPKLLRDEITFGVNGIFLIKDWLGFLPTYYVVEDNFIVEDRREEIAGMVGPHKFYSRLYKNSLSDKGHRTLLNVVYDYSNYENFPEFSRNAAKCVWCGGTVVYLCMQIAYYMGFEEVYLIGMDHNYNVSESVMKDGKEWVSEAEDRNHFHPDYVGKGKRWHDPQVDRMERAYLKARKVFEADGRRILNATIGGNLEVFPRCSYSSLFD